jgi:hypothetical protein
LLLIVKHFFADDTASRGRPRAPGPPDQVTAVLGDTPMAAWKLAASLAQAVGQAVQTGRTLLDKV